MGQTTIKLDYPIKVKTDNGDLNLTEITVGVLRAKHLKIMPKELMDGKNVNPAKLIPLVAALTGVKAAYIEELVFSDFTRVVEAVTETMGEQLSSGETGDIPSGD